MLGNLGYRLEELPCIKQEGHKTSDGKTPEGFLGNGHDDKRADCCRCGIGEIRNVTHYRHEDACIGVRIGCGIAEVFIDCGKILFCGRLVAENFNNLQTFDEFLDISVHFANAFLLRSEIVSTLFTEYFYYEKSNKKQFNVGQIFI